MNQEWSTPQWLFDQLDNEFRFVLDAAASPENAKCAIYFTREDNALTKDWHPYRRVWLNPPYDTNRQRGILLQFVGKAYHEAYKFCLVVCLLPAKTDTEWWHRYAEKGQKRFLKGRLYFNDDQGRAPFPSVVVIFSTWRLIVRHLLESLGGRARLQDLYRVSARLAEFTNNNHVGPLQHNRRLPRTGRPVLLSAQEKKYTPEREE